MKKIVIELNKKLQNLIDFEELGFQKQEEDNVFYIYTYKREFDEKTDILSYSFTRDKWKSNLQLMKFNASIVFPKVNRILKGIINKSNNTYKYLSNFDTHESTIIDVPEYSIFLKDYTKELGEIFIVNDKIYNSDAFELSIQVIKSQLFSTILPFLDKITSLKQVNDEIIEKYDYLEWGKFINGLGGIAIFKAIIIMKLCQNEKKYKEFTEMYSKRILEALENGETQYQSYYDFLIDLIKYLDSDRF